MGSERLSCRVFVIGKGKSLKDIDLSLLENEYTMCINHVVFDVPNPSAVVFVDKIFVEGYQDFLESFEGHIFCGPRTGWTEYIQLPRKYTMLSGLFALHVARVITTGNIYMLGYDMNRVDDFPYYKDHIDNIQIRENFEKKDGSFRLFYNEPSWISKRLASFENNFDDSKHRIFNCNPKSAIKTFQFVDYQEVINDMSKV